MAYILAFFTFILRLSQKCSFFSRKKKKMTDFTKMMDFKMASRVVGENSSYYAITAVIDENTMKSSFEIC